MKATAARSNQREHEGINTVNLQKKNNGNGALAFPDNRPEALAQRKLARLIQNSPGMAAQKKGMETMSGVTDVMQKAEVPEEEELLQGKFVIQRQPEEEEELLQGKFAVQRAGTPETGVFHGGSEQEEKF